MRWRTTDRPIDISARIPLIRAACEADRRILAGYLYGSYGTELQTPLSDVDFAVLLEPGVTLDLRERLRVIDGLQEAAAEDDFNVLILNTAPVTLQFSVLQANRPVFVRDEARAADFAANVYTRYGDYAIVQRALHRELRDALREEYGSR